MAGKTVVITGSASGMGRLTALAAAEAGMHVVGIDKDFAAGDDVRSQAIQQSGNASFDFIGCDLSSQTEVRALANRLNSDYERIDVLVNNAGITESVWRESADGFEMTMATNFLAPFLLTHLLLNKLKSSTPARIINIASDSHKMGKGIDWDNIDQRKGWNKTNHGRGFQAYACSKLCLVAFSYTLAEQLKDSGVTVYAVSPGYFIKTNIVRNMTGVWKLGVKLAWPFLQSAESGAKTHIYLTTDPDVDGQTGKYWEHCELKDSSVASHDPELQRQVWDYAKEATGVA